MSVGPHEVVHIAIQQGEMAARNAVRLVRGERRRRRRKSITG